MIPLSSMNFRTPNFFLIANKGCAFGVNWLFIKLQYSIFWWRSAKETGKFLKFCFWANSFKLSVCRFKAETQQTDNMRGYMDTIMLLKCYVFIGKTLLNEFQMLFYLTL